MTTTLPTTSGHTCDWCSGNFPQLNLYQSGAEGVHRFWSVCDECLNDGPPWCLECDQPQMWCECEQEEVAA